MSYIRSVGGGCVLISPFIETILRYPFLESQSGWVLAEEGMGVLVELDPATWLEVPEFEPQTVTLPCDQQPSPARRVAPQSIPLGVSHAGAFE